MLEKARNFDADVIVADLEDSVAPAEKLEARNTVRELAPTLSRPGRKLTVRINSLDTGLTRDELSAVVGPHLYGVSVGKVDSAWDMGEYHRLMTEAEERAGLEVGILKIIPWIESSRAAIRLSDIAAASSRTVGLAFGAEDYTEDMGIRRTDGGEETYFPRAMVAVGARAAGVASLDGPYVSYRDQEGLRRDVEAARNLGYNGKFAIHPAQIDIINSIFTPGSEEVEYAHRVVEAWNEAESAGRGATSLDGRMIDVPVVKRARNLLALAEAIAQRKP